MPDPPVYLSAATVARQLGLARSAVYNAFERGRIQAAAYVDDTPVFTEREIVAWRAGRYRRRNPVTR